MKEVTPGELNAMDIGSHMAIMEEWNEDHEFGWKNAQVILHGYLTRVIQEDSRGGLYIATYVTGGEGDLRSLRVYTDVPQRLEDIAPHSEEHTKKDLAEMHTIGFDYYYVPERNIV